MVCDCANTVPAVGVWLITMPSLVLSAVGCKVVLTVPQPWVLRSAVASAWVLPTSGGIATLPEDTLIVTVAPGATVAYAAGSVESTWFSGAELFWATTLTFSPAAVIAA